MREAGQVSRRVSKTFFKIGDNHRALEVGHLKESSRSFKVRRPKCEEGSPELLVRESPEELTLRAEEVGIQEVVYQCRSHCKGEMGPALGRR